MGKSVVLKKLLKKDKLTQKIGYQCQDCKVVYSEKELKENIGTMYYIFRLEEHEVNGEKYDPERIVLCDKCFKEYIKNGEIKNQTN
jgi:hypothetical protein